MLFQILCTVSLGVGLLLAGISFERAIAAPALPYASPDRLVLLWRQSRASGAIVPLSLPDLGDWRAASQSSFQDLGGFLETTWQLSDASGTVAIPVGLLSFGALNALRFAPVLGRGVVPEDAQAAPGQVAPVWLSSRLWEKRYGRSPTVLGQVVRIKTGADDPGQRFRIAGVLPAGARFPEPFVAQPADVLALNNFPFARAVRGAPAVFGLGRLWPRATLEQARGQINTEAARLGQQYAMDQGYSPVVVGLVEFGMRAERRLTLLVLFGFGLAMAAAMVHLASLLLAAWERRQPEFATRLALGARVARVAWGLVAEIEGAVIVGLMGAALVARIALRAAGVSTGIDVRAGLALAVSALMVAAVVSGVLAAHLLRTRQLGSRVGSAAAHGGRPSRWGVVLISVQCCLGVIVLAAAASSLRAFRAASNLDLGPWPERVLVFSPSSIPDAVAAVALLARRGEVASSEAEFFPPLDYPERYSLPTDAQTRFREATRPLAVAPTFFSVLGVPLMAGRLFSESDTADSSAVAVINATMAVSSWGSPNAAVGKAFSTGKGERRNYRVIGVVADFEGFWRARGSAAFYLPESQSGFENGVELVRARSAASAGQLAAMLRPLGDAASLEALAQQHQSRPTAQLAGMGFLALITLALALLGVYAASARAAAARRRELAIRLALGAPRGRAVMVVTGSGLIAALVGTGVGVAASISLDGPAQILLGLPGLSAFIPLFAVGTLMAVGSLAAGMAAVRLGIEADLFSILSAE